MGLFCNHRHELAELLRKIDRLEWNLSRFEDERNRFKYRFEQEKLVTEELQQELQLRESEEVLLDRIDDLCMYLVDRVPNLCAGMNVPDHNSDCFHARDIYKVMKNIPWLPRLHEDPVVEVMRQFTEGARNAEPALNAYGYTAAELNEVLEALNS